MRRALPLWLLLLGASCQGIAAGPSNPFAPLTAREIRAAAGVLRDSGRLPRDAVFSEISLQEPPKEAVLRGSAVPRRAFAVVYDRQANRTWEAVVDLSSFQLASWKKIPGAEPVITGEDSGLADSIVRADPRWVRAMRERGIRDLKNVIVVAWSAGYFALPGTEHGRIVRAVSYYGGAGHNFFAHPIEGVVAEVNLTTRAVLDFVDIDRRAPVPREMAEFEPPFTGKLRPPAAPLEITQPDGPGFRVSDGEVSWQKWHFRFGLNPREGLVLYTVGYDDGGRLRSILYRASVSEMVVPYGDPNGAWFFRNSFDVGEFGLGLSASPLRPGVDCPQNCSVFDAVVADPSGEPRAIPGAVGLYEVDAGLAWKHGDDARRARDLVLSFYTEVGNYEYGFDWIFRQDGTLEARVRLTGIMAVKAVAPGQPQPYSHMVATDIAAVHHQHFFNYRLDMDVDGASPNRVLELDSAPVPPGKANPYGGAFTMRETPLATELQARRNLDLAAGRRWIVVNPSAKNALGDPTGYALVPRENALPFAAPDSWLRKRAAFLNAHLWVTPYDPSQRYAAGDFPNQSRGDDGLARWTAANRSVDNRDVVLWYTLGITHNPRPEDWPVMPTLTAGFDLVPWGFFPHNPALDLPPAR